MNVVILVHLVFLAAHRADRGVFALRPRQWGNSEVCLLSGRGSEGTQRCVCSQAAAVRELRGVFALRPRQRSVCSQARGVFALRPRQWGNSEVCCVFRCEFRGCAARWQQTVVKHRRPAGNLLHSQHLLESKLLLLMEVYLAASPLSLILTSLLLRSVSLHPSTFIRINPDVFPPKHLFF